MSLKIVVLAKQVPDTRNVGKDAMTAEGTVNRAALPAIFNPDDLLALEQALRLKEQNPGSTVGVLTMGPPRAGEIIRQGLYRGADTGWLLTDRLFAGADTLATSYALATAIKKIGDVDLVIGGRQAIDGDTAQVGPQVAQKLGLNQVTYADQGRGRGRNCPPTYRRWGRDSEGPASRPYHGERKRGSMPSPERQTRDEIQEGHMPDGASGRGALLRAV